MRARREGLGTYCTATEPPTALSGYLQLLAGHAGLLFVGLVEICLLCEEY